MRKIRKLISAPQSTILSAATVIMIMMIAARVFGLIRLRVWSHFFTDAELSLFFASFRLPDLIFDVLTLGALSSSFIPVFSKAFKKDKNVAWDIAGKTANYGLIIFALAALLFGLFADQIYAIIAPGYTTEQTQQVAYLARVLFAAQGFFVVSYVMTGVLESMKRFIIPAIAPLFYNIGIILGTIFLYDKVGLLAPALGVVFGAIVHFMIQLPFAYKLGFRFVTSLKPNRGLKKIGKLGAPKMVELSILQLSKVVELSLASLISLEAYTYYNFAFSAQSLPTGLFGLSIAKAAFPTLASKSDDIKAFKKTFLKTLYQMIFFVVPLATILIVLRIPVVRILFGSAKFGWYATVQTGLTLSAFAVGVPFQAAVLLLTRSFYALHNTKTPVKVSLMGTAITITTALTLILVFNYSTWALAAAYASGVIFQAIALFYLLSKKLNGGTFFALKPILKSLTASVASGFSMFFILKIFDRSVWDKNLSFIGDLRLSENIDFESFVLDTKFTGNLIILTVVTALIGGVVYLLASWILKSEELKLFISLLKRRNFKIPKEEPELSPAPSESRDV